MKVFHCKAPVDLGLVLAYSGELIQGVDEIETALRLNPKPTSDTLIYSGIVFFIDGQYQRAVDALTKAGADRQYIEWGGIYLPAAYALSDQKEKAANTLTNLIEVYPTLSVAYYRARDTYFRRSEDLEKLLHGLSLAGLPDWPYDFRGSESNRLKQEELLNIVEDKTWVGKHLNGVGFFQQIDSSGSLAYRSKNSIQTGTASIQDGMLCQQFDGAALNRDLCGYVYRNPDGSDSAQDKYIVIMPDSLRYFSLLP